MKKQKSLNDFKEQTLFPLLSKEDQAFLSNLFEKYHFSFQEFRQLTEAVRDFDMWDMGSFAQWVSQQVLPALEKEKGRTPRERFFNRFRKEFNALKASPKSYRSFKGSVPKKLTPQLLLDEESDKKVFGWCPVASEKTVCCNLRTIDAVETCAFGCSYCTIQTFYSEKVVFDRSLREKLEKLELDPNRYYHIGTGQSSDSLVWGNRNGMLDDLCDFARRNPNVLLEFKTKSANISYFLENEVPPNIVCTWSLNPQIIIENEEHFTVDLEKRLEAAEKVAQKGVKVGFHFHPMIYYDEWESAYPQIAREIIERFDPEAVLFISMGSVTLIRPVIKQIRRKGFKTRILQMELVPDPHGKWTYPDELKIRMFRKMYQAFSPWHNRVFFYLCMEKSLIWKETFGYVYPDNEAFEKDMLAHIFRKLYPATIDVSG